MPAMCAEIGCPNPTSSRRLCKAHYMRRWNLGTLPELQPRKAEHERFAEKTKWADEAHPVLGTKCLLWIGARDLFGHGRFQTGTHDYTHAEVAQRVAWRLQNGEIPAGLCVLHRCDVPACVNPEHLFLGTRVDNMHDMRAKGRASKGEAHWRSKLTDAEIREIRAASEPYRAIANRFGVSPSNISYIKSRHSWAHIQ